jgi:hypothetical protein
MRGFHLRISFRHRSPASLATVTCVWHGFSAGLQDKEYRSAKRRFTTGQVDALVRRTLRRVRANRGRCAAGVHTASYHDGQPYPAYMLRRHCVRVRVLLDSQLPPNTRDEHEGSSTSVSTGPAREKVRTRTRAASAGQTPAIRALPSP